MRLTSNLENNHLFVIFDNVNREGLDLILDYSQALTILVFHVTWHGKGSMRYGCLIPGRVQACQTELTQGREWVRVMASQRRGQPRSKPEWVMGFLEIDGQLFYSRKDHHPLCSPAYAQQEFVFQ